MQPIRVLVCDDSVVVRRSIGEMIDEDPDLEVCGSARDGADALRQLDALDPDIVLLDIEMPVMDGLETLRNLRTIRPSLPVVMLSTPTSRGSSATLDALALGAEEHVAKWVDVGRTDDAGPLEAELIPTLKTLGARDRRRVHGVGVPPRPRPDEAFGERVRPIDALLVASSTGGPVALDAIFGSLTEPLPVPTLIVQHGPSGFSEALALHLDTVGPTRFVHAEAGTRVEAGTAYLAPGGRHMTVEARGADVVLGTNEGPRVNQCRPAADVLFESAESVWGGNVLCLVLTGMGDDGADGAARLAAHGASVIAQDEATSVVWGMPRAVADAGVANEIVPLHEVAGRLDSWLARHGRPSAHAV